MFASMPCACRLHTGPDTAGQANEP